MKNKRNERLNQVTPSTLVIGIDIAKKTHYACAVDDRGRELAKAFAFHQSSLGFCQFRTELVKLLEEHDKKEVLVGFEPTGHYWKNLAEFLKSQGIRYVLVSPTNVKYSKSLDDNSMTKNDKKDARVIGKLIIQGYYLEPRILEEIEAELREGSAFRFTLKKDRAKIKNRIIRQLDQFFPEFQIAFKDLGLTACALLRHAPLPADLLERDVEELNTLFKEEGIKQPAKKKIAQAKELARQSIGLTEGTMTARMEIAALVEQYDLLQRQLEDVTTHLIDLVKETEEFYFLVSIPGISEETVVDLLAETGALSNYSHPRQLITLAGLALCENSSGKHEGKRRLSKRGRRRLRALLYKAVLPLIQNNTAFRELYEYYISRKENPLKKKEALVVLCSKMLKVFYGLCRTKTFFDGERMKQDLKMLQSSA